MMIRKRLATPRLLHKLSAVNGVAAVQAVDSSGCVSRDAAGAKEVSREVECGLGGAGVINAGEHHRAETQAKTQRPLAEEVVDDDQWNAEDDEQVDDRRART